MSQMSQMSREGGNTKPPPSGPRNRSRKYCLTVNNWTEDEYQALISMSQCLKGNIIIGEEKGESGTPHLQVYFESKNQVDFNVIKKACPRAHIEKAKGSTKDNIKYCSKEKVKYSTFDEYEGMTNQEFLDMEILRDEYADVQWRPWQQEVIDLLEDKPRNRKIYWFYEHKGNVGKSYLCKWLGIKYNVIMASGKKADIFNQVKCWMEANPRKHPNLIICDIPRSSYDYVNYTAIEELKNGQIYSGKYEGGVCRFKVPHIICFANEEPDREKVSLDRWVIRLIEEQD